MSKATQHDIIFERLGIKKNSRHSKAIFKKIDAYIKMGKTNAAIIAAIEQTQDYKKWKQSYTDYKKSSHSERVNQNKNTDEPTINPSAEKHPQHVMDKVLIRPVGPNENHIEFNSSNDTMLSTKIDTSQDARQFRVVVKEQGCAIWPDDDPRQTKPSSLDGKKWEMRLKNPRAEHDGYLPLKRQGKRAFYGTLSRPDQKSFSDQVRLNCFEQCVVSGAKNKRRGEAAHLVEHCKDGVDHWSNGLWLRVDIHRLFDANQCAIDPHTLKIHFSPSVLNEDNDLNQYEGKIINKTKKPINIEYLKNRWDIFCTHHEAK